MTPRATNSRSLRPCCCLPFGALPTCFQIRLAKRARSSKPAAFAKSEDSSSPLSGRQSQLRRRAFSARLCVLPRAKARKSLWHNSRRGQNTGAPRPTSLMTIASDYVMLGDYVDADKWFTEVTQERPDDANAWYLLGRTKYNESDFSSKLSPASNARWPCVPTTLKPKTIWVVHGRN